MDHEVDPYRINIQSRDRDMANCGDGEAFRDSDRAPMRLAKSRTDWKCSVQASRCDAMENRPGRWDVRARYGFEWPGAFLHQGTRHFCIGDLETSSMLIRGGTGEDDFR
jgi:hypothetical protein